MHVISGMYHYISACLLFPYFVDQNFAAASGWGLSGTLVLTGLVYYYYYYYYYYYGDDEIV